MKCYTFLYARRSSEEDDRQALSLSAQERECRAYGERQGILFDEVVLESHTARVPGRPKFLAMLKRVSGFRARGIPVRILSHKVDRLLRNYPDFARLSDLLEGGLDIQFVTGSFPNNAQGRFVFGIQVAQAKYYVDNLSEEVRKGVREKLARGEWPGPAPLGYLNRDHRIVIDPVRGPLVRKAILAWATGEHSLASLSRMMAEDGLVGRFRGHPITKSNLRDQILTNPFYCGVLRCKGQLYPASHEPLVTTEEFERAQAVFTGRSRPRRTRHEFRYAGLLTCRTCGCAVVGDIKKKRYIYYRCSHRRQPCPEGYIREDRLGELLEERVTGKLRLADEVRDALREAAEELAAEETNGRTDTQPALQRRLRDLETRRSALLDLRLGGHVDDEVFATRQNAFTMEEAKIREGLSVFELPAPDPRRAVDGFIQTCNGIHRVLQAPEASDVRRLLRIVGSNYQFGAGDIDFQPVRPFDLATQVRNRPSWLPVRDSNPDKQIQILLSCR